MPETLAWRFEDGFGFDRLKPVHVDLPHPGAGEILLEMRAASLNHRDLAVLHGRMGRGIRSPLIPLSDGTGLVKEIGPGVTGFAVGDRVSPCFFQNWQSGPPPADLTDGRLGGPCDGVLALRRVFPAANLVHVPRHLNDAEAASLPCAGVTAWSAMTEPAPLTGDDSVLIHGSGGVGLIALLLARRMGAFSVVTTSSAAKAERLKALGADRVLIRSDHDDWSAAAVELNRKRKFDRVLELGGARSLNGSVRVTRPGGQIILIGNVTGSRATLDLNQVLTRRLTLRSVTCGSRQAHADLVSFIEESGLKPPICRVLGFGQLHEAYHALEHEEVFGKICIALGNPGDIPAPGPAGQEKD